MTDRKIWKPKPPDMSESEAIVDEYLGWAKARRLFPRDVLRFLGKHCHASISWAAVRRLMIDEHQDLKEIRERVCLGCSQVFLSLHKGHRLCDLCTSHAHEADEPKRPATLKVVA